MFRPAATTAVLLLAASLPATAQETPERWTIDTAVAALDLCNPTVLDVESAEQAAEAAGWPEFRKTRLSDGPGRLSVKAEADSKGSPRVGLAYQAATGKGTTIFSCYVQTTRPVTDPVRAELQRRYGGDGEGGWWMKQTPGGRVGLTLAEMVEGTDGFRPLLDKLPAGSRVIFVKVAGDDDETQVVTMTTAKAD